LHAKCHTDNSLLQACRILHWYLQEKTVVIYQTWKLFRLFIIIWWNNSIIQSGIGFMFSSHLKNHSEYQLQKQWFSVVFLLFTNKGGLPESKPETRYYCRIRWWYYKRNWKNHSNIQKNKGKYYSNKARNFDIRYRKEKLIQLV